jgi:hypothetical protein
VSPGLLVLAGAVAATGFYFGAEIVAVAAAEAGVKRDAVMVIGNFRPLRFDRFGFDGLRDLDRNRGNVVDPGDLHSSEFAILRSSHGTGDAGRGLNEFGSFHETPLI